MDGISILKRFDIRQLFRFFVDGRFHKQYNGWKEYDNKEPGSIQSLINGFSFVLDNYDLQNGLTSHYIVNLHKICLSNVKAKVEKSTPGDLRFLDSGMACFAGETTLEGLKEIFEIRKNDGTVAFHHKSYRKTVEELDYNEIYQTLQQERKIRYRPWYPNLTQEEKEALEQKRGLEEFYEVKGKVQKEFAKKLDEIVREFNKEIKVSETDDEKIFAISKITRDLELLHPFPDGNCRVFACVLMNHLLMYNGFAPSILYNPNRDGEHSYKEFANEIKIGIKNTNLLLKNPNDKLYNYTILDMSQEDLEAFENMTLEFKQKLYNFDTKEKKYIFLDLFSLQRVTNGKLLNFSHDTNMNFINVVAAFKDAKKESLYFLTNMPSWLKSGNTPAEVLQKIYKKGANLIVIDKEEYVKDVNVPVLVVKNVVESMKKASEYVRETLSPKRVLITGTVGKTGFKFQLHHLISKQTNCHIRKDSGNMEISICTSIMDLKENDKVEITEVAVGLAGVGKPRSAIVNPDLCIFTEIGQCHMDGHKTMANLVKNKSSVVESMKESGSCIVNGYSPYAYDVKKEILNIKNVPVDFFGEESICDAKLIQCEFLEDKSGWKVKGRIRNKTIIYTVPLVNSHAPLISIGVLLAVDTLGFDVLKAAKDYSSFKPFETMGEVYNIQYDNGEFLLYDQSRRGAIQGYRSAFNDYMRIVEKKAQGRNIAIIAGTSIYNDTEWTKEQHREIAQLINKAKINQIYTIGEYMNYVHENLDQNIQVLAHGETYKEIEANILNNLQKDDKVIIIGHGRHNLDNLSKKIIALNRV